LLWNTADVIRSASAGVPSSLANETFDCTLWCLLQTGNQAKFVELWRGSIRMGHQESSLTRLLILNPLRPAGKRLLRQSGLQIPSPHQFWTRQMEQLATLKGWVFDHLMVFQYCYIALLFTKIREIRDHLEIPRNAFRRDPDAYHQKCRLCSCFGRGDRIASRWWQLHCSSPR